MFLALLIPLALYLFLVVYLDASGSVRSQWRSPSTRTTAMPPIESIPDADPVRPPSERVPVRPADLAWTALDDVQVRRLLEQAGGTS